VAKRTERSRCQWFVEVITMIPHSQLQGGGGFGITASHLQFTAPSCTSCSTHVPHRRQVQETATESEQRSYEAAEPNHQLKRQRPVPAGSASKKAAEQGMQEADVLCRGRWCGPQRSIWPSATMTVCHRVQVTPGNQAPSNEQRMQ
jgi:hypothetical protein